MYCAGNSVAIIHWLAIPVGEIHKLAVGNGEHVFLKLLALPERALCGANDAFSHWSAV